MTQTEQERLHVLLKREGIQGFLPVSALLNYTHKKTAGHPAVFLI
jgi:hypothetical protein